jgi:selenocysteine-specific elongation factor
MTTMTRAAIIGTAGHIDHGKTLLVKLLTGVDTDRLKEEKKRGISIELGFASITLPSSRRCGVVDVPGHERFIRNMLAGAGGIDLILFVIAADEGVMPQTREHMDILELLGVNRGVVALTKVDMVDADWCELVTSEVGDFISKTILRDAPILPVSAVTGQGKDALLAAMDAQLDRLEEIQRGRFCRLPIDRVFSMEGFGTVVTGTLWGGSLREGLRVHVQPQGVETRIKSLEVHGERVQDAQAGQRVAVCLHSVPRDSVDRGDWLVLEDELQPVDKIDVRLRVLSGAGRTLETRTRVRFHLGASEVMGRVVLLDADELDPGREGLAQIQLEARTVAERGDRFVLRSYSPMHTLGGGRVLDVSGSRRRRFRQEDLETLRVAEDGTIEDRITERIRAKAGLGLPESELTQQLGQPPAEIHAAVARLLEQKQLVQVGRTRLITGETFVQVGQTLRAAILDSERAQPLRFGPLKSELKSRQEHGIHPEATEAWIQQGIAQGTLFAKGDRLRASGPELTLPAALQALASVMLADLERRGFAAPTQKEFLETFANHPEAGELLQHLLGAERVVRVPPDLLLPAQAIETLRGRVSAFFAGQAEMTVADLKEALGVSRKQGVPLLEYLDRAQWTVRRGDVRAAGPKLGTGA